MKDFYIGEDGIARHDASGFYAKVVLDSLAPSGRRLCSVEAKYWRAIHSEVLTHRDRARNAASSRAIPFIRRDAGGALVKNCTYSMIADQGFTPTFIGAEQKGMQSGGELAGIARVDAEYRIRLMKDFCLEQCQFLHELGVHKSIINRYLEPWSHITILMTASRWKNFFRLRVHPKAEKHFCLIATMIKAVIDRSEPQVLRQHEWHTPYIRPEDQTEAAFCPIPQGLEDQCCNDHGSNDAEEVLKRVSAGRCARLSYLNHDGVRALKDDLSVFKKLIVPDVIEDRDDDVIHASPLEHVAQARVDPEYRSGPYQGWHQFRKDFAKEDAPE